MGKAERPEANGGSQRSGLCCQGGRHRNPVPTEDCGCCPAPVLYFVSAMSRPPRQGVWGGGPRSSALWTWTRSASLRPARCAGPACAWVPLRCAAVRAAARSPGCAGQSRVRTLTSGPSRRDPPVRRRVLPGLQGCSRHVDRCSARCFPKHVLRMAGHSRLSVDLGRARPDRDDVNGRTMEPPRDARPLPAPSAVLEVPASDGDEYPPRLAEPVAGRCAVESPGLSTAA